MFFKPTFLKLYKKNKKIYDKLKYLYKFKKDIFFNVYINKKKYLNILFNNSISFFKKSLYDYFNYLNWIKKYDLLIHKYKISRKHINLFNKNTLYNEITKEKQTAFFNITNKNKYINNHKLNYFYNFSTKFNLLTFTSNDNDIEKAKERNTYIIRKEPHENKSILTLNDYFYNLLIYNNNHSLNHRSFYINKTKFYNNKRNYNNKSFDSILYNFINNLNKRLYYTNKKKKNKRIYILNDKKKKFLNASILKSSIKYNNLYYVDFIINNKFFYKRKNEDNYKHNGKYSLKKIMKIIKKIKKKKKYKY